MAPVTRKRVRSWTARRVINTSKGVAAYVRISQDKTGQELGTKRQRDEIIDRARRDGVDPAQIVWFEDNDLSATKRGVTRPDFERLLDEIERGTFGIVYVWAADRLLRTLREWVIVKDVIDEVGGLKIACCTGADIDPSSPAGNLIFGLMVIMAENEGALKAERQRAKYAQQVNAGEPPRIRGFGYTKDHDIIESEAIWVREIFRRFNAGHPLNEIVRWLDQENVRNTRGSKWLRYSLRNVLSDPRYISQRARFNEGGGRKRQVINEQGDWPSIVERADFELAQIRLAELTTKSTQGNKLKYLGSGLFVCGRCQSPMRMFSVQSSTAIDPATGKKRLTRGYRCESCRMSRTRAVEIDAHVSAMIMEHLRASDLADLLAQSEGEQGVIMSALSTELDELAGKASLIEAKLIESLDKPSLYAALDRQFGLIDERRTQIREQLDSMHVDSTLAMLVGVDDPGRVWESADVRTQQDIARAIGLHVELVAVGKGYPAKSLPLDSVKIAFTAPNG